MPRNATGRVAAAPALAFPVMVIVAANKVRQHSPTYSQVESKHSRQKRMKKNQLPEWMHKAGLARRRFHANDKGVTWCGDEITADDVSAVVRRTIAQAMNKRGVSREQLAELINANTRRSQRPGSGEHIVRTIFEGDPSTFEVSTVALILFVLGFEVHFSAEKRGPHTDLDPGFVE